MLKDENEKLMSIKELAKKEPGFYVGENEDNEMVTITITTNNMIVKTYHKSKPQWWECVEYDLLGNQQGVFYEHD